MQCSNPNRYMMDFVFKSMYNKMSKMDHIIATPFVSYIYTPRFSIHSELISFYRKRIQRTPWSSELAGQERCTHEALTLNRCQRASMYNSISEIQKQKTTRLSNYKIDYTSLTPSSTFILCFRLAVSLQNKC